MALKFFPKLQFMSFKDGLINSYATKFKSLNDLYVNEGEALRLSFSETRNLKEISVTGAVLKPFKVVGNPNGISLKALLKGGAVLKQNAVKRIAFVTSNHKEKVTATAINLGNILNNSEDTLIFPGDILEILNEKKYWYINNLKNIKILPVI